jgi:ribosomal protein L11 methyltransferase
MPSFSLTTLVSAELKDLVVASGYAFGMSGCTEEAAGDGVKMILYFDSRAPAEETGRNIAGRFPGLQSAVAEIADQDWNAKWKASMQPALIAPGMWVSPAWLVPPLAGGDHWIKIEPKTAFGTGHHATTRLAARGIVSLHEKAPRHFSLLDIGTGTGVLCFVAGRCGAGLTLGIDNDPVCAGNLAENRSANPSSHASGFAIGTLAMFSPGAMFDCVVMNMLQIESQPLLGEVFGLLKPAGRLIWSGILIEEKNNIVADATQKGFRLYEETTEEEWWCGSFIRE